MGENKILLLTTWKESYPESVTTRGVFSCYELLIKRWLEIKSSTDHNSYSVDEFIVDK